MGNGVFTPTPQPMLTWQQEIIIKEIETNILETNELLLSILPRVETEFEDCVMS